MIALETAIRTWFDANQTEAFPGGIWTGEAEESTQMPYVVMTVIASPMTQAYAGSKRSQPLIQFAAFGTDHDAVGGAFESFVAAMDQVILTLTSGQMSDNRRLDDPHDDLMPPDGNGQGVWRWMSQYQFTIKS